MDVVWVSTCCQWYHRMQLHWRDASSSNRRIQNSSPPTPVILLWCVLQVTDIRNKFDLVPKYCRIWNFRCNLTKKVFFLKEREIEGNSKKKKRQNTKVIDFTTQEVCVCVCVYVVGQQSSRTHHHVLAMAALDKSLSMVWWWHISVSQLCCWSMAVSFWVASITVGGCFGVPPRECQSLN